MGWKHHFFKHYTIGRFDVALGQLIIDQFSKICASIFCCPAYVADGSLHGNVDECIIKILSCMFCERTSMAFVKFSVEELGT